MRTDYSESELRDGMMASCLQVRRANPAWSEDQIWQSAILRLPRPLREVIAKMVKEGKLKRG